MEFTIDTNSKCNNFTTIVKYLRELTDFIKFNFSETGIYVQGMDGSQVCLYELRLNNDWFKDYSFTNVEHSEMSVSSKILFLILNIRQDDQIINLSYEGEKLQIEFTGEKSYDKFFEIPTMEIISEHLQVPNVDYDAEFHMESSIFSNLMSQLKIFDEKIIISCNEENISLDAKGLEGRMKVDIDIDELDEFSINDGETITLSYSLLYINKISEFSSISKEAGISISNQWPLKVLYKLDDKYDENSKETSNYIEFHVAPSIEE